MISLGYFLDDSIRLLATQEIKSKSEEREAQEVKQLKGLVDEKHQCSYDFEAGFFFFLVDGAGSDQERPRRRLLYIPRP